MAFVNINLGDGISKEDIEIFEKEKGRNANGGKMTKIKKVKKIKPYKQFSQKILERITYMCVTLTIFGMALSWKTNDPTVMIYLIPAWFVEFGTFSAFYLNMSKAEKVSKNNNHIENENKTENGDDCDE